MAKSQAEIDLGYAKILADYTKLERKAALSSLHGPGGVYARDVEYETKIKEAIARFHGAVGASAASTRIKAVADMAKLVFTTPERLAKLTSASDKQLEASITKETGITFGDDPARSKGKAQRAWEMFYQNSWIGNGSAMLATYYKMVGQFGRPEEAWFLNDAAMQRQYTNIEKQRVAQENLMMEAKQRLLTMTDNVESGNEQAAMMDFNELTRLIPAFGKPDFVKNLEEGLADEKKRNGGLLNPANIAERDMALERLESTDMAAEEPAKRDEKNLYAKWLSDPHVQEWAKFHGFQVGTVRPITPELQEQIDAGKFVNGLVTEAGLYLPGPDDERARDYGYRERTRKRSTELLQGLGLGRPTEHTKEFVEFDVADPNAPDAVPPHADGKWYKEGDRYLTEAELAEKRAAAVPAPLRYKVVGTTKDGGTLYGLEDDTWAYAGKGSKVAARVPDATVSALLPGAKLSKKAGQVPAIFDKDALPPGVTQTDQPPIGARQTVRLRKTMTLDGRDAAVEGYDENGKWQKYSKDQVIGPVRNVSGGYTRTTLTEHARAAMDRKGFKDQEKALDENQEVAGKKPTKEQVDARREKTDELREGKPGQERAADVTERHADRASANADRLEALARDADRRAGEVQVHDVGSRHFVPRLADVRRVAGLRAQSDRLDERAQKAGDHAQRLDAEADELRAGTPGIPAQPYAFLWENLGKRKSSPDFVDEHSQRAKTSDGDGPETALLQGGRGPIGTASALPRGGGAPLPPPGRLSPLGGKNDRPASEEDRTRYQQEEEKRKKVTATGTQVVTPTAGGR